MENSDTIVETRRGSVKIVRFNKPKRKNAIDANMYQRVTNILNEAAIDNDISMVVLTGTGDYYSSGNDLIEAMAVVSKGRTGKRSKILNEYIHAFITFPKTLVAIVNGPAIGIVVTTLPLCDLVFASEDSYFYTPFSKLGIVAEGSSSYTFPRLIGDRKAAEMLLFDHKMSAKEALDIGFINYVYKPEELQSKVWVKLEEISKLSRQSLIASKKLMRSSALDAMIKAYELESVEMDKVYESGEFYNSLVNFVNKKSKI